jgi:hypothetical protein
MEVMSLYKINQSIFDLWTHQAPASVASDPLPTEPSSLWQKIESLGLVSHCCQLQPHLSNHSSMHTCGELPLCLPKPLHWHAKKQTSNKRLHPDYKNSLVTWEMGKLQMKEEQCDTGKLRTQTPEPFTGDNIQMSKFSPLPPFPH